MTDSTSDLRDTIVPRSDQLNADDLQTGPITVTVESVRRGTADQPVSIGIDGGNRPFRPCKSMRRVLIAAWGNDGRQWVGKSMTLYCDPEVKFGGVKVGGIRISHLSDMDSDLVMPLTITRGKKAPYTVKVLRSKPAGGPRSEVSEKVASLLEESVRGEVKRAAKEIGLDMSGVKKLRDFRELVEGLDDDRLDALYQRTFAGLDEHQDDGDGEDF